MAAYTSMQCAVVDAVTIKNKETKPEISVTESRLQLHSVRDRGAVSGGFRC